MSQFMTPAVTPDAVQSLAAGGQLLQEQYNQQMQNARTGAQIGAETRMHAESLAQDSREKAAYRQLQAQTSAAELQQRSTAEAKERELRIRLAIASQEKEAVIAEADEAYAEALRSGDPEAVKAAEAAREEAVQAHIKAQAAATAHATLLSTVGKAPGEAGVELDRTTTALMGASKMFQDAIGSAFRHLTIRMSANDPQLGSLADEMRAFRELTGGNAVKQAQADRYLQTGEKSSATVLGVVPGKVGRNLERAVGALNEGIAQVGGYTTHEAVDPSEVKKLSSRVSASIVAHLASTEEFQGIVENPADRAAASTALSKMASLLIAKGGTYDLKAGAVPEGGKIAASAKPEIDNQIKALATQLEGLGVTAQEQADFFDALAQSAAGALDVGDMLDSAAGAEKRDSARSEYSGEREADIAVAKSIRSMGPAYRAALGGKVGTLSDLQKYGEELKRVLSLYSGSAEEQAKIHSLLGNINAAAPGTGDRIGKVLDDFGVNKLGGSKQNVASATAAADAADRRASEAKRKDEESRGNLASRAKTKKVREGTDKVLSRLMGGQ